MTPLLWAYPDNKLERIKRLLEHGADPNVIFESDFNSHGAIHAGTSITHMACSTAFPGYFEAVFEHGGDPKLVKNGAISNDTPLFSVIKGESPNKFAMVKLLIGLGVDLNHMNGAWATPTMQAVTWGAQYDISLLLLEAGADHRVYIPKSNSRLIHIVLADERRRKAVWTSQQAADYQRLLKWLEEHGESIEDAKADRIRWASWSHTTGEYTRTMAQEVAQRKAREAREAREKQAAENADATKD